MATNNFTADGGEWNTAGNWSLGHVPTSSEDATFTGITTGGVTITVTTTAASTKDCDFSTAGATFTISGSVGFSCYGSLTCKTGMTWDLTATGYGVYIGRTNGGTLTTNGVQLKSVTLGFGGGTVTLGDALYCTGTLTLCGTAGLNTGAGNYQIDCTGFGNYLGTGTVSLTLGSSTINCTSVVFSTTTLTVADNTATVHVTPSDSTSAYLNGVAWGTGGDTIFHFHMPAGKVLTLNGANTVGDLLIDWAADDIQSGLKLAADQVVSGTLTISGAATVARPLISSSSIGTARHIHANAATITGALDFRDIHFDPHTVDLSAIPAGNCGGNEGITFRAVDDYYLDFGTADAAMTDNCWATSSGGGAGGTGAFPLPQDTIYIDDSSWDDTGNTFTLTTNHRVGNINMASLTEAQTIVFGAASYVCGDLILAAAGTNITVTTTDATITLDSRLKNEGSDTLDINIKPDAGSGSFTVAIYSGQVGTVRLLTNNLTHTGTFTLYSGIFDLNGLTLTTALFSASSTRARVLQDTPGGGKIVITGVSGTPFTFSTTTNLTVDDAPDIQIGTSSETLTGNTTIAFGSKPCTFGDLSFKKYAGNYTRIVTGTGNTFGAITQETPDAV